MCIFVYFVPVFDLFFLFLLVNDRLPARGYDTAKPLLY